MLGKLFVTACSEVKTFEKLQLLKVNFFPSAIWPKFVDLFKSLLPAHKPDNSRNSRPFSDAEWEATAVFWGIFLLKENLYIPQNTKTYFKIPKITKTYPNILKNTSKYQKYH